MKIFFYFFVLIHGLIHLLGFMKAFHFVKIDSSFTTEISKPIGLIWLLSTGLFLLVAILAVLEKQWVWIPALLAVLLSQSLIILTWQDAKFGTVPNLLVLLFVLFSFASWNFNAQIEKETELLLSSVKNNTQEVITEEKIAHLPFPVQRWLHHSGVIGKKPIEKAYFRQQAKMKLKPEQKDWYPAEVEQYVAINPPGFLWKVHMKMLSIPVVGKDQFHEGKGAMTIKVGALIPVANEHDNAKIDQSTMQRFLMELVWYPSAALSPYLVWEEIDENSAKVTMNDKGVSGTADFYFDSSGELIKVSAMRYKDSDENAVKLECIGEAKEYGTIDGINIPTKVDISWVMDDGLFTWYETEILEAKYG